MRIYIAGKMRGIKNFNKEAFYKAEDYLKTLGVDVYNPCRDDEENGISLISERGDTRDIPEFSDKSLKEIIKRDVHNLVECDGVYLLTSWKDSKGAQAEKAIAEWLGIEVMYEAE